MRSDLQFHREGTYQSHRAATLQKIMRTGGFEVVEAARLLRTWERQADRQGLDRFMNGFWDAAERWIANQPRSRWPDD
jgi:hypothetical protein